MKNEKLITTIISTLGLLILNVVFSKTAVADGLSTSFADVQLNQVPVGVDYPVNSSMGPGLLLKNLGKSSLLVVVDVLQPGSGDLRGGAKAIPDIHWVQVTPAQLELPAHGQGRFLVTLKVPSEKRFRRRYYQVTLWSHSKPVSGQGVGIGIGLQSRLRFKTK
jgi:hypothetical protein